MPRVKKNNSKTVLEIGKKGKKKALQTLKGMRDILPSENKYWKKLADLFDSYAEVYSFGKIKTPIMEFSNLFIRAVGQHTDIVNKEMYSFVDQGKDKITLRPEMTAPIVRSYIQHGMANLPQPVKLFYNGNESPVFRHEKPQSGRYREFHQSGFEVFGENNVTVDVQLLFIAYNIFKDLNLDVQLHINSIGCPECRPDYLKALSKYYKKQKSNLCDDCKTRVSKNPLRLLDCKEKTCQSYKEEAPHFVDHLCENCNDHFTKILEYLEELEIPYLLDHNLVRGLDYYTRTVFEFVLDSKKDKRQNALAGGGRYDLLVEQLGGKVTPAVGIGFGVERIILAMKEAEMDLNNEYKADIFIAQIGDVACRKAMLLFEKLRRKGFKVAENFAKSSLKAQLDQANRKNIKLVLILGQQEVLDNTILLRDMEGGVQETVAMDKLISTLKSKIKKRKS